MGVDYRFFLNDIEIEEPIGFSSIELSVTRDDKMHGMQFEASTTSLQFYGEASEYLREQKALYGLRSEVIFLAEQKCDITAPYEDAVRGRLNFGKYKDSCGSDCLVTLPVETDSCEVTFKNRFDQKVNIDVSKGFDGATLLPEYAGLVQNKELMAKFLLLIDEARNSAQTTDIFTDPTGSNSTAWEINETPNTMAGHIAPRLDKNINASLGEFTTSSFIQLHADGANNRPGVSFGYTVETERLLGNIKCGFTNVVIDLRVKGSHTIVAPGISDVQLRIKVFKLPDGSLPDSFDWVQLYTLDLPTASAPGAGTFTATFDHSANIPITLIQGDKLTFSLYIRTTRFAQINYYAITLDPETFFKLTADSICENSRADLYLVHETLSRTTEAITDYCMRVKSTYYGRMDSQPFAFNADGCGGLRYLTSGLKIRNAKEDSFFVSLKELIEGLQAIDNIGMAVEPDPDRDGYFLLRVEDLDFFYTDTEIMFHESIPDADSEVDESKHYSKIMVGYKKWEVQRINGLDEFNSNREYRTALTSVANTLDITSNLVAGGYPIEVTRQQSFAETGGADTSYDNETFIITAARGGPYGIEPEQGGIDNPLNIYSPGTAYNYKLSPLHNLLRWYRLIINSYASVTDSGNKIYFNSGTGNYVASGKLPAVDCTLENQVIKENQDLYITHFLRPPDYTPRYKNETITYEYPMSLADYKRIKANPYGYIRYQCGKGPTEKGYIKEVKYRQVQGMATITLKKKW